MNAPFKDHNNVRAVYKAHGALESFWTHQITFFKVRLVVNHVHIGYREEPIIIYDDGTENDAFFTVLRTAQKLRGFANGTQAHPVAFIDDGSASLDIIELL